MTFALGYALASSRRLVDDFLNRIGAGEIGRETPEIRLQERSDEGITDVELHSNRFHILLEAKMGGWPRLDQLKRYAKKLSQEPGRKILCPMAKTPISQSPAHQRQWRPPGGITLQHLRWADILGVLDRVAKRDGNPVLNNCITLIEEVLGMQAYDREVLVRDVEWGSDSFELFFRYRLYVCQVSEIAEPLFFAPCFSGNALELQKGIHYFSRVYFKYDFVPGNLRSVKEALAKAEEVIDGKTEALKWKKTAREQSNYLKSLLKDWTLGIHASRQHIGKTGGRHPHAIFFLGDPVPLPRPVFKNGKMVPLGFSVTLEQLMSKDTFNC